MAAEIMKTPVRRGSSTSISGAINFALQLFEENCIAGRGASSTFPAMGRMNDVELP